MKKANIYLTTGFEEIEAISIIDVLRRAGIEINIVSVTGNKIVTGSHNISVMADSFFDEVNHENIDAIILPGGPGHKDLDANETLKNQILTFNSKNKLIAAICASPMIFGKMGLLKGKKAVCYPGFEKYLQGAEILKDTPTVESGNVITGAGPASAIWFALKIVEKLISKEKANALASDLILK